MNAVYHANRDHEGKNQRTNIDKTPCLSAVVAVPPRDSAPLLLESLCSCRDHPKGPRNCYLLQVGTWRRDLYSGSPSMIDREQRVLKWLLPMRTADREPVLRHEIDEFIP